MPQLAPPTVFNKEKLSYDSKRWLYDIFVELSHKINTLEDSATPSIAVGYTYLTGGTTTITDFTNGFTGQIIRVLSEHAITITDGTNIFLNGSANFVMASTDSLTLIQKADGNWYELSRSVN